MIYLYQSVLCLQILSGYNNILPISWCYNKFYDESERDTVCILNRCSIDFWNIGSQSCFHEVTHYCLWHHLMSSILPGCPGSLLPIQTMIISIDEASRPVSISVSVCEALLVIHQSSDTHSHIISMGTDSRANNTFLSRSSSLDNGGYW